MAKTDMNGKVCLVTSSSSGLGKDTAMGLARLGATVILGCRDKQRGEAALAEIKTASSNQMVELMLIDLPLQHSVRSMVAEFEKRYDHLDVLIASSPEVEGMTGLFFKGKQAIDSNSYSKDQAVQKHLWEISTSLTGLD
jgi:NAD(P)-dependent dehydrogenase (short-subunit alcohol dehydrogenase family)